MVENCDPDSSDEFVYLFEPVEHAQYALDKFSRIMSPFEMFCTFNVWRPRVSNLGLVARWDADDSNWLLSLLWELHGSEQWHGVRKERHPLDWITWGDDLIFHRIRSHVHCATLRSILSYYSKTRSLYVEDVWCLKVFDHCCLHEIAGIERKWPRKQWRSGTPLPNKSGFFRPNLIILSTLSRPGVESNVYRIHEFLWIAVSVKGAESTVLSSKLKAFKSREYTTVGHGVFMVMRASLYAYMEHSNQLESVGVWLLSSQSWRNLVYESEQDRVVRARTLVTMEGKLILQWLLQSLCAPCLVIGAISGSSFDGPRFLFQIYDTEVILSG